MPTIWNTETTNQITAAVVNDLQQSVEFENMLFGTKTAVTTIETQIKIGYFLYQKKITLIRIKNPGSTEPHSCYTRRYISRN